MASLSDEALTRAACRGIDPRTMYDWAWNDKTGRPAPGLAKALAICGACPVREECAVAGLDEIYGVWVGTIPPERGQVRGIRHATDADPLEILYRIGEREMIVTKDGKVVFTKQDIVEADAEMRDPIPGNTAADVDARFAAEWEAAKAEHGSYLDIPVEVRDGINERHRLAHVERVEAEKVPWEKKKNAEKAARRAAEKNARCPKGHDLSGYMPSTGKPVLTAGGACRMCQAGAPAGRKITVGKG